MHNNIEPNDQPTGIDVVCFSHLRWDFVFQRPQHLMTRFARNGRVFFIEEPVSYEGPSRLDIQNKTDGVYVCVPQIESGTAAESVPGLITEQISMLLSAHESERYIAWFYTPMMLDLAEGLTPLAVVYDCMDELSGFRGAPPELLERERQLMEQADVVFTGGHSLFQAKRTQHGSVHAFPSSVDVKHFGKALKVSEEVADQAGLARPRIGFAGVIDERLDVALLDAIAGLRPDWQFVMIGPVVKISEDDLPDRDNIHYLGMKAYEELPQYLAGWDVAMMPFALNESTKYISPTKTPEYLSAGLPVVSTPIADVVRPYGEMGLVHIASNPEEFVAGIEAALAEDPAARMTVVNEFLAENSWDNTFRSMSDLIEGVIAKHADEKSSALSLEDNKYAGPDTAAIQGEIYV
jgi:UDP-galactopyranose mutase